MDARELDHIVWCDLEILLLKVHSSAPWDTKMVSTCAVPDLSKPTVDVYICREDDPIFDSPTTTYRESVMRQGSYRGHHSGPPARLKCMDDGSIAFSHPDPGKIIWSWVIKYLLTVGAIQANMLHIKGAAVAYKGRAFLILGRGGSGKTEVAKALCRNGAGLMANTHLLIDGGAVCGIRSNMRVREDGRDVYVPADQQDFDVCDGWLPIGGVFWVNYRTDGRTFVQRMPSTHAKANMQFFAESIRNWEIKEDIADRSRSDPFEFAEWVIRIDDLLDGLCERNDVYYVNLDVFSPDGLEKLLSLMETSCSATAP